MNVKVLHKVKHNWYLKEMLMDNGDIEFYDEITDSSSSTLGRLSNSTNIYSFKYNLWNNDEALATIVKALFY